ncbi:GD24812 [Drosophila simulans]|uniref:GD24812 n=1 Tax=Drosophila simulans TaxID=7240 RepID=B4NUE4_DROSI|nr:GD24812 [Drosophila simulans]
MPPKRNKKTELQLQLNALGAPRRGAFELSLSAGGMGKQEQVELWSGLKRGPPRALKFPTVEEVYDRIVGILNDQQESKELTNTQKSSKIDLTESEAKTSPKKSESTEEAQGTEAPSTSRKSKKEQKSEEEQTQVDSKEAKQSKELAKTKRQPKAQKKPAKASESQKEVTEEKPVSSQKRKRTTRSSTDEATASAKRRR